MNAEELERYKHRLMGLIPPERIVKVDIPRVSQNVIDGFMSLDGVTPTVSDILDSMGIIGTIPANELRPVTAGKKIVGPAVTIRYIREAHTPDYGYQNKERAKLADRDLYAVAEKGDVPVFDTGGADDLSVMGGLSTLMAKHWGMAGNIVDGGVRDVDDIRKLDYPVWSRGQTPKTGKYRVEAIEINCPIVVADVRVEPGDLIIADDSGVVVVPFDKAAEVLHLAIEATKKEEKIVRLVSEGASVEELIKILPPSKW